MSKRYFLNGDWNFYYLIITGLRGFHVYRDIWKPSLNQFINFKQERNNGYYRLAVAEMTKLPETLAVPIVGHMLRELSRFIWYAKKKKVASLSYSLEEDYVDESKDILEGILKENDCDLLTSDDDDVVETEENTEELVVINDD